ncbi:hypothetical protein BDZ90DRAFT_207959, partial [Jaminaea rosea]
LPEPDSLVLARVTRITSRQAVCSILLVLPDPSSSSSSGVIRQQDVRLTETDKVKVAECFRVGDLVRARVISLGDSRSYFLSTASNELGVVFATASVPGTLRPLDWQTMVDPATGRKERRKVAKPTQ